MEDWQLIQRLKEVLADCERGKITDSKAIKKLMRTITKFNQTESKRLKLGNLGGENVK